jgi:hypothetical protein
MSGEKCKLGLHLVLFEPDKILRAHVPRMLCAVGKRETWQHRILLEASSDAQS